MKVCQLLSNQFSNDNRVNKTSRTLTSAGYGVTVLCIRDGAEKLPDKEIVGEIEIKRVVNWLPFMPKNKMELRLMKDFYNAAVLEKADVYHANDLDTLLIGWLASKKNKAKLVYDSHEYWYDKTWAFYSGKDRVLYRFFSRILEKFLIKKPDIIFSPGKGVSGEIQKRYSLKTEPLDLSNFVSLKKYIPNNEIREEMRAKQDEKLVVYVGVIVKGRGLGMLIDLASELPANYKIGIIGYGYFEKELKKEINKRKLTDRVFLLGKKDYDKIPQYLSGADIGIAPIENICTSYYLATPNKISEFVMAGLPVVCSDYPGMNWIINKYDIGKTFNPENTESVKRAIMDVADPNNYKEYVHNVSRAKKDLSWEHESNKLLKAYQNLWEK